MDSELDPRTSFDVGEHLERCQACARRFGAELALERDLTDGLKRVARGPQDAATWERITDAVRRDGAPTRVGRPGPWRRIMALVAALLLLALGLGAFLVRGVTPAPLGALGKAACHSHDEYVAGTERPEVATSAADEVHAYFRAQLGLDVNPPPDLALVGARRCAVGTVHLAYVMARRGQEPVSAFVLPARDLGAFPEAQRALARGNGRARAQIHGHEVLLASEGDLVACVVGSPEAGDLASIAQALVSR